MPYQDAEKTKNRDSRPGQLQNICVFMLAPTIFSSCTLDQDYHKRIAEQYRIKAEADLLRGKLNEAENSVNLSYKHAKSISAANFMLASALETSSRLRSKQGNLEKAIANLKSAAGIYKQLEALSKTDTSLQALSMLQLAHTETKLAELYLVSRNLKEAERHFKNASKIYDFLRAKQPESILLIQDYCDCLNKQARLLDILKKPTLAEKLRVTASELRNFGSREWLRLRSEALSCELSGKLPAAMVFYKSAWQQAKSTKVRDFCFFQSLADLKRVSEKTCDWELSAELAAEEYTQYKTILAKNDPKLSEICLNKAIFQIKAGQLQEAMKSVQELEIETKKSGEAGHYQSLVKGLSVLGEESCRLGKIDYAKHFSNLARQLRSRYCPDQIDAYWYCRKLEIDCLLLQEQNQKAVDALEETLGKMAAAKIFPAGGKIANDLVEIVQKLASHDPASKEALQASRAIVEIGADNIHPYELTMRMLGQRLVFCGYLKEAEPVLKNALTLAANNPAEKGYCYIDMASMYNKMKQEQDALICLDKAKQIFEGINYSIGVSIVSREKAALQLKLAGNNKKKQQEIETLHKNDIEQCKSSFGKGRQLSAALVNYAVFLIHCKRYKEAEAVFEESIDALCSQNINSADPQLKQALNGYADLLRAEGKEADMILKRCLTRKSN